MCPNNHDIPSFTPMQLRPQNPRSASNPHALSRTILINLFTAVPESDRKFLAEVPVKCQNDIDIRFTGMRLNQHDLDVWDYVAELAQQHPGGTQCEFSDIDFLQRIGRGTGQADREWLRDVLKRLAVSQVFLTLGDDTYFGVFIQGAQRDIETGRYRMRVDSFLARAFASGEHTIAYWEQRARLRNNPLALWLHSRCTCSPGYSQSEISELWQLSAFPGDNEDRFRQNLMAALNDLKASGAIRAWSIRETLLRMDSGSDLDR